MRGHEQQGYRAAGVFHLALTRCRLAGLAVV